MAKNLHLHVLKGRFACCVMHCRGGDLQARNACNVASNKRRQSQHTASTPHPQVQEEAAARLPPEPTDGNSCRVAVRLPDGSRVQRSFSRSDPVQVLHDFCITNSAEAAGGRRFQLGVPGPGGVALTDTAQTLEAAGVANAMLVMAWSSS